MKYFTILAMILLISCGTEDYYEKEEQPDAIGKVPTQQAEPTSCECEDDTEEVDAGCETDTEEENSPSGGLAYQLRLQPMDYADALESEFSGYRLPTRSEVMFLIDEGEFDWVNTDTLIWTTSAVQDRDETMWVIDLWLKRSYEGSIYNEINVLYIKEVGYE